MQPARYVDKFKRLRIGDEVKMDQKLRIRQCRIIKLLSINKISLIAFTHEGKLRTNIFHIGDNVGGCGKMRKAREGTSDRYWQCRSTLLMPKNNMMLIDEGYL